MDSMPLMKAAALADLEQNGLAELISGDDRYAVCRVDEQIFAVEGICPHRGGPLAQGALHGKMIVCPWHAWEFDCTTGENDISPNIRLATYPVTIEDNNVLVEIPDAGTA